MEVDVRELGGSKVTVHVRLDENEVRSGFDRTYQRLSDRGGIRGFRPGKVPRAILNRHYDADGIRALTYEELVQDRLDEALKQYKLHPLSELSIEQGAPPDEDQALADTIKTGLTEGEEAEGGEQPAAVSEEEHEGDDEEFKLLLEDGKPFEFYTTFVAYPRPQLPDLSQIKLRRPVAAVTDDEVEEQIERLRRINAEEVEVDRNTIEDGDLVVVDIKVVLEDEDAGAIKARREEIVIGEREYLADIDRALIGRTPGDIVEQQFVYPDDFPDDELRGKSARIIAEIDSFSGRKFPDLTDEFARSIGDFESMEDLRSSIRRQLQAEIDRKAENELTSQLLRQIVEGTSIDLPEQMVESAAARSYEQLQRELQQLGMSAEDFAEAGGLSVDELRENEYARAKTALTLHFALEALTEERGVEVEEEDLNAELMRVAEESGGDLEFVRQAAMLQPNFTDDMRERALRRKLIDQLIADAQIEDVPAEEYFAERAEADAAAADESVATGANVVTAEPESAAADQESEAP